LIWIKKATFEKIGEKGLTRRMSKPIISFLHCSYAEKRRLKRGVDNDF